MTLSTYLSLAAICFTGAASPGPSLAVVAQNTLQGGRASGLAAAWGHALGVGIYAALAVMGASALLVAAPELHRALTLVGAAYLAWMGWNALTAPPQASHATPTPQRNRQGAQDGFAMAFLNPKIAVFFLALFGPFVPPETAIHHKVAVALMAGVIDGMWYSVVAFLLTIRGAPSPDGPLAQYIPRALGALLLSLAATLVFFT